MLACLDVHETEVMLRRQIVRHLTKEYDAECRAPLRSRELPRNELEEILRERLAEVQAAKPVGFQNTLFAGAEGRSGEGTGTSRGSHRGNRPKGGRVGGRGGRGTQGATASRGRHSSVTIGFLSPGPASGQVISLNSNRLPR